MEEGEQLGKAIEVTVFGPDELLQPTTWEVPDETISMDSETTTPDRPLDCTVGAKTELKPELDVHVRYFEPQQRGTPGLEAPLTPLFLQTLD